MIKDWQDKTVWLIGASSGIGRALAQAFAERGARLLLSARRENALSELAESLGQQHLVLPLDISDEQSVIAVVKRITQQNIRVDSIICLAGAYEPGRIDELTSDTQAAIINTNINGTFNVIRHTLAMLREHQGQLAIYGSVAGYRGLPKGQPYSATKAALINLAESLYLEEQPNQVDVKLINSGFVDTDLTRKNQFAMPMMISTEEAAEAIINGLGKSAFEIHFPKRFTYLMKCLQRMPNWLFFVLARRMN
jgi:short-subunit dehydrogenase